MNQMLNPKYVIIEGNKDERFNSFEDVVKALIDKDYYSLSKEQKKEAIQKKAVANALNCMYLPRRMMETVFVKDNEYTYILSLIRLGIVEMLERSDSRVLTKDIALPPEGDYVRVGFFAPLLLDKYQKDKAEKDDKDEGVR